MRTYDMTNWDYVLTDAEYYSPEDPEDVFEPVGTYTSEDLAFLVDARVKEGAPTWISETQGPSL